MASTSSAVSEPRVASAPMHQPQDRRTSGPDKIIRRIGAVLLAVILLFLFNASTNFKRPYQVWGVFHYYLGAKYLPEVGYFNLYSCALEADEEGGGYWYRITEARDMETYRIVSRSSLPPCPLTNFTPERWSDFRQDVEYFAHLEGPDFFANLFTDKGFNPPPFWAAVAMPLARALPISNSGVAEIVFNLDVAAVLLGVLIVWRSCSGVAALLTAGLTIFYFGNYGLIGGNFLQYLWFPLTVVAITLWAKNQPGLSGAVLGVAGGLQVFPLFFGLPIVFRAIIEIVRRRKPAEQRLYFRFTSALIVSLLACFLLGSLTGRGVGVWGEWQRKISIHKHYLQGEIFNIGLANLTAAAVSKDHSDGHNYVDDLPKTMTRLELLKSNIWIFRFLCAIFLAMWVFAVVRAPAEELFGHGFLIMYAAVSASPYYYLTLALVPLMFWNAGRVLRAYATYGTIALFAIHAIVFRGQLYVCFRFFPHLLSACSVALFLLGLAAISTCHSDLLAQAPAFGNRWKLSHRRFPSLRQPVLGDGN